MIPKEVTNKSLVKVVVIVFTILMVSSVISWLPLVEKLEDFFVNGMKYENSNSLFIGCPDKYIHREILQKYYGRIAAKDITWAQIKVLVDDIFSNDYGGISRHKLSFYGNAPVCLFKYYVKMNDPQQGFVFVIICINFACFVTIAVSYMVIVIKANKSARRLMNLSSKTLEMNEQMKKRNTKLQKVTQWIIFTDFACWVPFIITCCLHYADILDATPWYPFFSILVLPINSVINPLLYDLSLRKLLYSMFKKLKRKAVAFFHSTGAAAATVAEANLAVGVEIAAVSEELAAEETAAVGVETAAVSEELAAEETAAVGVETAAVSEELAAEETAAVGVETAAVSEELAAEETAAVGVETAAVSEELAAEETAAVGVETAAVSEELAAEETAAVGVETAAVSEELAAEETFH